MPPTPSTLAATFDANSSLDRRRFVAGSLTAAAAASLVSPRPVFAGDPGTPARKIKIGIIGAGGRGGWIANLFKQHGGYEFHAVADYFPNVAEARGKGLGVDPARCFSGLSAYKKLIESGVEAVILKTPPYFISEHAKAAVEAGLHVYAAKPVASDVPGTLLIGELGKQAAQKKRVFLVDYQMPTDPANNEVAKRVREGAIGKMLQVVTVGASGGFGHLPKGASLEFMLKGLYWIYDIALGGDFIVNYDIHAIDAATWLIGKRPVAAAGASRIGRTHSPDGDSRDVCSVVYEYDDGLIHNHLCQGVAMPGELSCRLLGQSGSAQVNYWGDAYVRDAKGKVQFTEPVKDLYAAGAKRNIAAFYTNVVEGKFENETAARSVDCTLTTILGREAAARKIRLTMDELVRENKKLTKDLSTLKA
jgi:myo-inositol 2-dehydrogenase/D-chiro-inositol 1-dehydrogenase